MNKDVNNTFIDIPWRNSTFRLTHLTVPCNTPEIDECGKMRYSNFISPVFYRTFHSCEISKSDPGSFCIHKHSDLFDHTHILYVFHLSIILLRTCNHLSNRNIIVYLCSYEYIWEITNISPFIIWKPSFL